MWEFTRALAKGLEKGDTLAVIALAVAGAVWSGYKLYPLLLERKKSRLKGIEAALKSEWVEGAERECLKEQAATEHFHVATGIQLERAPREAWLGIYEHSGGRLSFVHFKRAASYVSYASGKLEIRLNRFERAMMWVAIFVGIPLFAISAPVVILALYWSLITETLHWETLQTGLIFFVVGWVLVLQSRPAYSAHRILKEKARQAEEEAARPGQDDV